MSTVLPLDPSLGQQIFGGATLKEIQKNHLLIVAAVVGAGGQV